MISFFKNRKAKATVGNKYSVQMPNAVPVILRAETEKEVRAMVRQAHNIPRLPAGTQVRKLDV